jgi:hypothetical protein
MVDNVILLNLICATLTQKDKMPLSTKTNVKNRDTYQDDLISMYPMTDNYSPHFFSAVNSPIKELIRAKMEVSTELKNLTECEEILEKIERTTVKLPHTKEIILQTLNQGLTILCTSLEQIQKYVPNAHAYFGVANKMLFITNDGLHERLINYEFRQANNVLRHQTKQCYTKDENAAVLPIFPATKKNIEAYKRALDKGDQRIRDFKQLRIKEKESLPLTEAEDERLLEYKLAAKDCLLCKFEDSNPPEMYDRLVNLGWRPDIKGFFIQINPAVTLEVLNVTKLPSESICLMQTIDPIDSVLFIDEKVTNYLNTYFKYSRYSWLAERDAFTFETLSDNAIKTFYPEAGELWEKDVRLCNSGYAMA